MKEHDPHGLAHLPWAALESGSQQRHRATRSCAHHATDADELATWLDMLGLNVTEGRTRDQD